MGEIIQSLRFPGGYGSNVYVPEARSSGAIWSEGAVAEFEQAATAWK